MAGHKTEGEVLADCNITRILPAQCWEDWQKCDCNCDGLDKWFPVIFAGFMSFLVVVANLVVIVTILTTKHLKSRVINLVQTKEGLNFYVLEFKQMDFVHGSQ